MKNFRRIALLSVPAIFLSIIIVFLSDTNASANSSHLYTKDFISHSQVKNPVNNNLQELITLDYLYVFFELNHSNEIIGNWSLKLSPGSAKAIKQVKSNLGIKNAKTIKIIPEYYDTKKKKWIVSSDKTYMYDFSKDSFLYSGQVKTKELPTTASQIRVSIKAPNSQWNYTSHNISGTTGLDIVIKEIVHEGFIALDERITVAYEADYNTLRYGKSKKIKVVSNSNVTLKLQKYNSSKKKWMTVQKKKTNAKGVTSFTIKNKSKALLSRQYYRVVNVKTKKITSAKSQKFMISHYNPKATQRSSLLEKRVRNDMKKWCKNVPIVILPKSYNVYYAGLATSTGVIIISEGMANHPARSTVAKHECAHLMQFRDSGYNNNTPNKKAKKYEDKLRKSIGNDMEKAADLMTYVWQNNSRKHLYYINSFTSKQVKATKKYFANTKPVNKTIEMWR